MPLIKKLRRLARTVGEITRGSLWLARGVRQQRRQDYVAALSHYAQLVRGVQPARESMKTYAAVERLFARAGDKLADQRPDDQPPQRFVFFVGYSRSGHSLVGSLLDAHPHVTIAHEMHALKQLRQGHAFAEVVTAIKTNAMLFDYLGREYTGYDYHVPGQSQGHYTQLLVAGDKKGNGTLRELRRHPHLLGELDRLLPVPFSFVHVIRNPYDNIATRARRTGASLEQAAQGYFANAELMEKLKARYPDSVLDIYLDDLIAAPAPELERLLHALGCEEVGEDYLAACAAIVFKKPSRTARSVSWEPALVERINARLRRHAFLNRFADRAWHD